MLTTLVVFLSVLLFCKGQVPIPSIAETFASQIEVEMHTRGETEFGTGGIARDQKNQLGVEFYNMTKSENVYDIVYRLERYSDAKPMEYHIRGPLSKDLHCSTEIPDDPVLKPFFGWVAYAKHIGTREVEHLKVDLWVAEFGGTKLQLGLDPESKDSTPLILLRETAGEMVILTFKTFNETVIPTYFDVPPACKD